MINGISFNVQSGTRQFSKKHGRKQQFGDAVIERSQPIVCRLFGLGLLPYNGIRSSQFDD
jgi:hypothetical protein